MSVSDFINQHNRQRQFSFEVLPPLKGTGTDKLFADIDKLAELEPAFINITTHHSEYVYREVRGYGGTEVRDYLLTQEIPRANAPTRPRTSEFHHYKPFRLQRGM